MRDSTTCCSVSFTEGQSLVVGQESALAICQLGVLLGIDNVGVVESQLLQTQASSQDTHLACKYRLAMQQDVIACISCYCGPDTAKQHACKNC